MATSGIIRTKNDVLGELRTITPELLYSHKIVNYQGKTTNLIQEFYTEIIAEYLIENNIFETIEEKTRRSPYKVKSHSKEMEIPTSNREEEIVAISLFKKLENVIDYQVPLKDKQTDKLGKIDLLLDIDKTLILGELKRDGSTETLLRAVLEVETYFRIIDKRKLLSDFDKKEYEVGKALLIFRNSEQYNDYNNPKKPFVNQLLKEFGIRVFLVNDLKLEEI